MAVSFRGLDGSRVPPRSQEAQDGLPPPVPGLRGAAGFGLMSPRLLRIALLAGVLLVLTGIAAGTMFLIERLHENAERSARQSIGRLTKVAEGVVSREFLRIDAALAGLPGRFASVAGPIDADIAQRLLREMNAQTLDFRNIVLVQRDGTPWAAALPRSASDAAPLDAAEIARTRDSPNTLLSGPVRDRQGDDWALYFLREVRLPDSPPLVALAEVPVSRLTELIAPLSDRLKVWVILESVSGRLIAMVPQGNVPLGQQLRQPAARLLPLDGEPAAIRSRFTNEPAIVAARPTIFRDVLVVTGFGEAGYLERFRTDRRNLLLGAGAAGLLTLALGGALFAGLRGRIRLAEERAEARMLLERAIDSMPDGFVMWDRDDRLVICNDRYREMYAASAPFIRPGIGFEELIRKGAEAGQYPQAGSDIEAFVRETVAWHQGNRPPMERLLPDGTWLLVTERRLPSGGTVGIRTDITALKRTNDELMAARDAAAAATEAKSRFLARMSHELRTPLNAVMGLAQLLAGDPALSGEQRDRARTLEQAGRHAVDVANSVLDLARVEAGHFELRRETVALPETLAECVALFDAAAKSKEIALLLHQAPGLPAEVLTDRTRLRQLLLNLLSNAVKFTPPRGQVELRARAHPAPIAGEAMIRLEVRDTGPGIPAGMRRAIFDDFVQLGRQDQEGTGLGLAITAEIVQRMHGRIGCEANEESTPPRGAVFWVEIPMPLAGTAAGPTATPATASEGRALNILVADDVPTNLAVARALLESGGHRVTVAADGSQALEEIERAAAAKRPYDVVLMDVMMPGMDGLEATRRIRALPQPLGQVPILAVTASAFAEDIAACKAAGMDGHLAKPIERATLLSAVARLAAPAAADLPPALVIPGLDAAASASLVEAFLGEIADATAALEGAPDPAGMIAAAHRLAGAAATLALGPLAEAARRFEREAKAMAPAADAAGRAALIALARESLPRPIAAGAERSPVPMRPAS